MIISDRKSSGQMGSTTESWRRWRGAWSLLCGILPASRARVPSVPACARPCALAGTPSKSLAGIDSKLW